ncbi:MAG: NYN domain-containing protein [SAR324 cluster bacterium]|nr:NYN domain-containing protein [SAR324 cluster bacterium]
MKKFNRIALFIDGTYHGRINQYFGKSHQIKSVLEWQGLFKYIESRVSSLEQLESYIVEVHYFKGLLNISNYTSTKALEAEHRFNEVLSRNGIIRHDYPVTNRSGKPGEKGIDVSLALEAYEKAVHGAYEVGVLIAGDEDYVPLLRKINSLGIRTMVVGFDAQYMLWDKPQVTRTSAALLNTSTYAIMLHEEIESRVRQNDSIITGLFLFPPRNGVSTFRESKKSA